MIGYLRGKVTKRTSSSLLIDVNGVGYRVKVPPQILADTKENANVKIYTHQYVREDEISLYGFKNYAQLQTFELLIAISGIGPKIALNILTTTSPSELRNAVAKTDLTVLSRVPGIGKKSASKIMLELSNKLNVDQSIDKLVFSPDDEMAIEALVKLGFKKREAQEVIQKSAKNHDKLEDKIKAGLRHLNK